MRRLTALVFAAAAVVATSVHGSAAGDAQPSAREGAPHAVPLYGYLERPYDAPADPYAPGHRGIDVAVPVGTPVRASASGTVAFAGSVAGNLSVTIDHADGLLTSYSFLSRISVKRGDPVAQGTVLGHSGRGHAVDGMPPHVHLSARRDGLYFDPTELYVGSSYADLLALTA